MGVNDLYPNTPSPTEISMRDELGFTFDGSSQEVAKSQPCIIRGMRRDNQDKKIPCECQDPISREPDKDRLCPICLGEGFKWDETLSKMYKVLRSPKEVLLGPGSTNVPSVIFYMRHNANITREDKIVELVLDSEGLPVQPYKRRDVFKIIHLDQLRLDNGRLEYLRLVTIREDVKHLNAGVG